MRVEQPLCQWTTIDYARINDILYQNPKVITAELSRIIVLHALIYHLLTYCIVIVWGK
jgi:hypothetical protein